MYKFFHFLVLLLILNIFLINQEAYAYINPGSGSYILQTVIGWFLSVGYFFKKLIFPKKKKNKDVEN